MTVTIAWKSLERSQRADLDADLSEMGWTAENPDEWSTDSTNYSKEGGSDADALQRLKQAAEKYGAKIVDVR